MSLWRSGLDLPLGRCDRRGIELGRLSVLAGRLGQSNPVELSSADALPPSERREDGDYRSILLGRKVAVELVLLLDFHIALQMRCEMPHSPRDCPNLKVMQVGRLRQSPAPLYRLFLSIYPMIVALVCPGFSDSLLLTTSIALWVESMFQVPLHHIVVAATSC